MAPQFFPVDYDPWSDPEDTASAGYAGMKKLAGAAWHTVVDPWTRPLSEPYRGAVLPFSSQGKGDLSFDSGAGLLGGIKSGVTLPGDVYAGRVNPLSQEGFGRVQDAASLLSGGPMLGGGGAKASMGFGGGDGVFTNITKALKNKSAYHPDMSPDELVAHALEASGGDPKKAKNFIETKYNEQALGLKAEENHYAAYDTLGQMGKGVFTNIADAFKGKAGGTGWASTANWGAINGSQLEPSVLAELQAAHALGGKAAADNFANYSPKAQAILQPLLQGHVSAFGSVAASSPLAQFAGPGVTITGKATGSSVQAPLPSTPFTPTQQTAAEYLEQHKGNLQDAKNALHDASVLATDSNQKQHLLDAYSSLSSKSFVNHVLPGIEAGEGITKEAMSGSLPSTPHLSWTKGEDPKDLLAHDWITPHGLTSDEDPAHVAGMVLAASGGDVDKAKGLLKNNPFEHSSFFAPDKETLQDAAKHLDNPYFADETHTPVPLNAEHAKQYNAFTDLPAYQDEEGKKFANDIFHQWLTNNEKYPSKLSSGKIALDPWADLQSVTHPGVPAGEGEWPDLQAEMHKLLGTPEHAIPLTQSIHPASGHLDWTVGKTPHDLIQNHGWVSPTGNNAMPLTALSAFGGDKDKAINYVKTMLKDNPDLGSIFSEKDLTDPIKNFSGKPSDLPLPLSSTHNYAFTDVMEKKKIPWNDAQADIHEYLTKGLDKPSNPTHDYSAFHFPSPQYFKTFGSATPSPKPSFTGPPAPPPPLPPLPVEGRHGPFLPEPPTIYRPFVGKGSYKNALQPYDWQSDVSPLLTGNGNVRGLDHIIPGINHLTDDDLQRILEQGHNPNLPLFKGLQGEKEQYAYERGQFTNPFLKPGINAERGIFFGNLPQVADSYGNRRAFFARPQNPLDFDWANTTGHDGYSSEMSKVLESAWDRGGDAVKIRNVKDIGKGGFQTQYVFRDPMALRYTHAKFDPAHVDSAQLSWAGGVPVFAQPVDYNPWEKSDDKSKN